MKILKDFLIKASISGAAAFLLSGIVLANPQGGVVTNGSATISNSGNTTTINQTSQQAIVNWDSFNIAHGETTHFQQPASGVALNRINPNQGASQIYGTLSATGTIILINGAGVHFGPGSQVDVGSIIVSTSDITDANFLKKNYVFDQTSDLDGSIINEGTIKTADYGLVALLGTGVVNSGVIEANLGSIAIGAGSKFTLNFNGDQLLNFTVDEEALAAGVDADGNPLKTGVENTGKLIADGGQVMVTASVAAGVLDNVIDMSGVAQTHSVSQSGGEIILSGEDGNVLVTGKLDASGKGTNSKGGTVEVLGQNIDLASSARIDVSGGAGGGNIFVGGNEHGAGLLPDALNTTIEAGALLNASAIYTGNGGNVIVWSNNTTNYAGTILAQGGADSGNGGFSEVSGHDLLNFTGKVNLSALHGATGTLLLDPEDLYIQTNGPTTATPTGSPTNTYTSNQDSSILTVANLEAALLNSNVLVTTGSSGTQLGNITVSNNVIWNSGNSLTLTAANNIILNTAQITNSGTGDINFTSPVMLQANSAVTTGGNINFSSTIDGAQTLSLSAGTNSNITVAGSIGASTPLTSFTTTTAGTGATTLSGSVINTTGDQTYNTNTLFSPTGNLTITSTSGTIHLENAIVGTTSSNNYTFNGNVNLDNTNGQFGGAVIFQNGLVNFNNSTALGSTASVTIGSGATFLLNVNLINDVATGGYYIDNGGVLQALSNRTFNSMSQAPMEQNSGGSINVGSGFTLTLVDQFQSFSNPLVKTGAGTLAVSDLLGAATINVNAGTLVNSSGAVQGNFIVNSGGTLTFTAATTGDNTSTITVNSGGVLNINNINLNSTIIHLSGTGSGSGALTATGASAEIDSTPITLSANSTISAPTVSDTLTFGSGTSFAGAFALTLAGSGNINLASGVTTSVGSLNSTVATLNLSSNVTTSANQSYTGGVALGASVTLTSNSSGSISLASITGNGNGLTIDTAGSSAITGVFSDGSGASSLTQAGSGTLTLSGANTFTGGTTISAGTISLGVTNALLSTSSLVDNAIFNLNGFNQTLASIDTSSGSIMNSSGTLSVFTLNNTGTQSYDGSFDGNLSLTKNGSGTLILTQTSTYSGFTTINAGVLQLGASNALSTLTDVVVNTSGTFNLNNNSNTIDSLTGSGIVTLGTGFLSTGNSDPLDTFSGQLTGSGTFVKNGNGEIALTGNNTGFTGTFQVGSGELLVSSPSSLNLTNIEVESGATLSVTNATIATANLDGGTVIGTGTTTITGATAISTTDSTIATGANSDNFTLTGDVNGATNLILQGAGTVKLNGASNSVANLTSNAATTGIGGNVTTTNGSQIYNGLVAMSTNATLTGSTIMVNAGVNGGHNLTITGSSQNNSVSLIGSLAVNNIVVTGGGTTNSLVVQTPDVQTWNITSGNGGAITGIAEQSGTFNFSNFQNITGSNNGDTFKLTGGTISGAITGGTGNNVIIADNVANTFNITGANSGSLTGVNSFTSIENLVGGSATNDFIFANLSGIAGTINGTSASGNILDFSAYAAAQTVNLTADGVGVASHVSNFSNIQNLIANSNGILDLSANKANQVTFTGATSGFVNDPVNFSGFTTFNNTGTGTTSVTFGTGANAIFTSANTASINNGTPVTFANVQSYSGNYTPYVAPPPAPTPAPTPSGPVVVPNLNGATVASVINAPTQSGSGNNSSNPSTGATLGSTSVVVTIGNNLDDLQTQQNQSSETEVKTQPIYPSCQ